MTGRLIQLPVYAPMGAARKWPDLQSLALISHGRAPRHVARARAPIKADAAAPHGVMGPMVATRRGPISCRLWLRSPSLQPPTLFDCRESSRRRFQGTAREGSESKWRSHNHPRFRATKEKNRGDVVEFDAAEFKERSAQSDWGPGQGPQGRTFLE